MNKMSPIDVNCHVQKVSVKALQDAQDDLEQYTRRQCLEIRDITEITNENTGKECGIKHWSGTRRK